MFLVSSRSCLCWINWSQVSSREWRCSWSGADRRCSNYIWVINNFIAHQGATYIRGLTVVTTMRHMTHTSPFNLCNIGFALVINTCPSFHSLAPSQFHCVNHTAFWEGNLFHWNWSKKCPDPSAVLGYTVNVTLQWRHNGRDGVSNHQPRDCLLSRLFGHRSEKKNQSSASLACVRGIHRWPVNSPHKWPVTRKKYPFDDVTMIFG